MQMRSFGSLLLMATLGCGVPRAPTHAMDANMRDGGTDLRDGGLDASRDATTDSSIARDPHFTRIDAGIDYDQWTDSYPPSCYLPNSETCIARLLTGGVAVRDVDLDGDLDVYVTRMDEHDLLFVNDGAGHFVEATPEGLGEVYLSNGAAWGDIDNDGYPDLFVTTVGEDRAFLFRNDRRGGFLEVAESRGVAMESPEWPHTGMSACFGDYDLDGHLDLHTTEWRPYVFGLPRSHNRLLRNRATLGLGFFADETDSAGVAITDRQQGGAFGFTSHLVDLDGDRWPDLPLVADYGATRLFWNEGNGTFLDGTESSAVGTEENGMGSALGDYDGDGDLDWFVTSVFYDGSCEDSGACPWGRSGNRLYRNDGSRGFTDVTDEAGVRDGGWGWGATFFDYDLDGDLDLAMTNGVQWPPEETGFATDNIRLWRNDGGTFTDVAAELGIEDRRAGKGLVAADLDGDGDEDLLVVNNLEGPSVWRNDASERRAWLTVRPVGTVSNRDGFGAVVRVWVTPDSPPMVRHAGNGCGFLGNTPGTPHFGLGEAEVAHRVEVYWPVSDQTQVFMDVPARQVLEVVEPRP